MKRKNISYTMSEADAARDARMKRKNEERERRRKERLEQNDRLAFEQFNRVRNVITGRPNTNNGTLAINYK